MQRAALKYETPCARGQVVEETDRRPAANAACILVETQVVDVISR